MIMKKLAIAMMLSVSALAASAQVNYKVQTYTEHNDRYIRRVIEPKTD